MDSTATIVESQCDWLTITKHGHEWEEYFTWYASRVLRREERLGGHKRPFAAFGYTGDACGRLRWGVRSDGQMIQLSGDLARAELDRAVGLADNCSRIDLAVTVRIEPTDLDLEARHYDELVQRPRGEGRRPSCSLVQSDDGGATLYLGKRTSDVMLRVYNKAVESGDPRYVDCHRYELEVKGKRAWETAQELRQVESQHSFCLSVVQTWSYEHGLTPAFDGGTGQRLVPGLRRQSDVDTKVKWLGSAVRPTVDWLREFGHQARALHALGYDEELSTRLMNLEEVQESTVGEHEDLEGSQ